MSETEKSYFINSKLITYKQYIIQIIRNKRINGKELSSDQKKA